MPGVLVAMAIQRAEGGASGEWVIGLLWIVGFVAGMWRVFEKAGRPGWATIVPIYGMVVLLRITNQSRWCMLLVLIPGVNVLTWFIINLNLAWRFGKDLGYAFGLTVLPFIFYPILGFGRARFRPGRGPVPLRY